VRPATILEDLRRRDFSVNAMARPLGEGLSMLLDPHGGRKDLRDKKLRVLHEKSFVDDPTRLFRAARYASRLDLRPEARTAVLMREAVAAGIPGLLSRERIRQELLLLLGENTAGGAISLLKRWGLFPTLHKDFAWYTAAKDARGPLARVGLCALAMPAGSGEEFLGSLHLDREQSQALLMALRQARARMSPRSPLPELSLQVLAAALPKLPKSALKPVLLNGEDLKRLGLTPGKDFSRILDEAARAQWRGEFRDRAGALAWLRFPRARPL
jgi:tRNA nucleotidyltransferase (CCA-adding enzyme)